MKILHIIPHYLPSTQFGGSPVSTHNMAAEQVKQGHQVDVLTTDAHSPHENIAQPARELHSAGYRIIRLNNFSNTYAWKYKFHLVPGIFWFLLCHLHEYDVVHLREYRTTLNIVAALLKRRTSAIYILQPHGVYANFGERQLFKRVFDFLFQHTIHQAVDKVIAISQKEMHILEKDFSLSNIELVYHGVPKPPIFQGVNRRLPDRFILFVGRLHANKRLDYLIKAFHRSTYLRQKNIHLVIAGSDDGFLNEVRKLVQKLKLTQKIHLIGGVDCQQKYALYRRALLTTYVTHEEPFGLVPIEAASVGCWSIIDQESGVAELLHRVEFADVVTSQYIGELTQKMEHAIRHRKKVSLAARHELLSLSTQKQARLLESIYLSTMPQTKTDLTYSPA